MEQVLLVIQVIIAMGLIGLVLIQRSDSDGFGLSGGSGNNLLSGRASANALTRITAIFAAAFIINSLALGVLAAHGTSSSIVEKIEEESAQTPAVPSVPLAGSEKPSEPAAKVPAENKTPEPMTKEEAKESEKPEQKKPLAKKKAVEPAAEEDNNE